MIDCSKILILLLLEDKMTRVKPADSCVWEQTHVPLRIPLGPVTRKQQSSVFIFVHNQKRNSCFGADKMQGKAR